jgi:hypothetical protein
MFITRASQLDMTLNQVVGLCLFLGELRRLNGFLGGVSRHSFNAIITTQELSEYYLPSFQSCVRDAKLVFLN